MESDSGSGFVAIAFPQAALKIAMPNRSMSDCQLKTNFMNAPESGYFHYYVTYCIYLCKVKRIAEGNFNPFLNFPFKESNFAINISRFSPSILDGS
jgi:hypothetical protein